MSIISVKNLSFSYDNSKPEVLHNISFDIKEGSYTAIVGSNGSGKSTLSKLICGLLNSKKEEIKIQDGKTVGLVFQSPKNQIVSPIVYRDTAFGPQNLHLHKSEVELRTIECLNITGMLENANKSTSSISLGQTQKVALSGMLAIWPDVLVLDEAVAMLDPISRYNIFDFLKYWHKRGRTIIHITHDMDAIEEADSIIDIEKGNIIFEGSREDFKNKTELVNLIKGPEIPFKEKSQIFETEPVLSLKKVDFKYNKNQDKKSLSNINFTLYKGTVTALTGPSGAGKSTILELCTGLLKPVNPEAKVTSISKPSIVLQNCSDALFRPFAADDVAFGPENQGITGKELKARVVEAMRKVNLPFEEFADSHTIELSGGQQRRLAIAGIIALNKDIIILDEPTAGLDGQSRYEVIKLMKSLADEGKTVLFSTHKRDEADFADREINIHDGRIVFDTCKNQQAEELEEMKSFGGIGMLEGLRKSTSSISGENRKEKSFITKFPASLRIILFLALFVCSLAINAPIGYGIIGVLSFIYCKLCGFSILKLLKGFLKVVPFLILFAIFQMIFQAPLEGEVHFTEWKWFLVTPSKLFICLRGFVKTVSAMACICGFFISTPEYDLIDGLKVLLFPLSVIKIPVRYLILIFEIMFRFIPLLLEEAYLIIKTQIIRGGLGAAKGFFGKIKNVLPLFVPLIIQTIRKSEALAEAITMRGFK